MHILADELADFMPVYLEDDGKGGKGMGAQGQKGEQKGEQKGGKGEKGEKGEKGAKGAKDGKGRLLQEYTLCACCAQYVCQNAP